MNPLVRIGLLSPGWEDAAEPALVRVAADLIAATHPSRVMALARASNVSPRQASPSSRSALPTGQHRSNQCQAEDAAPLTVYDKDNVQIQQPLAPPELQSKIDRLGQMLAEMGRVAIAFSGGVDSALLLYVASRTLGENCLAVIGDSEAFPEGEIADAVEACRQWGVRVEIVRTHEISNPEFAINTQNRCYHCKTELFSKVREAARREGMVTVADGTQVDDTRDHRPGMRAGEEQLVRSPLLEAGFTKREVREAARLLGLEQWDKPSFACLSSRFPYGTRITQALLEQVDTAERSLREMGFRQVRVRHHDSVVRIEVEEADLPRALEMREAIVTAMKEAGYVYASLDLEGYRSGKMNDLLRLRP